MSDKRHQSIGIKQTLRLEWLDKAAHLMLAGAEAPAIRQELTTFLSERKGDGSVGLRSAGTRDFAVQNVMKVWVAPDPELVGFRDEALAWLQADPAGALAVHWSLVSAVYPFWFQVARQAGRLLALQEQATQAQVVQRLREHYGDRNTVIRCAQFVLRSFVAWGVLEDCPAKGAYQKAAPLAVRDPRLGLLLLEGALHATPEGKAELSLLASHPALFPFRLPPLSGAWAEQHSHRLEVTRYGLDQESLSVKRWI